MPNKTIAVHTSESNISRLDQWAEKLRRSRNSLMNEGIEMVLELYDADALRRLNPPTKKKAGAR
jgi:predicted transcriptional regulator